MKPKPFSELNHLTVPDAIIFSLRVCQASTVETLVAVFFSAPQRSGWQIRVDRSPLKIPA
jgi:hypothetical protein